MTTKLLNGKKLLREWIEHKACKPLPALDDDTPILEQRILSSLQVMELILFIEATMGQPVTLTQLTPAAFKSINAIHANFFAQCAQQEIGPTSRSVGKLLEGVCIPSQRVAPSGLSGLKAGVSNLNQFDDE